MNKKNKNTYNDHRKIKILFLFLLVLILMSFFLLSVFKTIHSDRRVPSNTSKIHDRSFRGAIISQDGYTLSNSEKTYKAIIRGASLSPGKKPLFIKLFSIYSGIPEKVLAKKFKNKRGKEKKGNITLSDDITARSAMQLKSLSYKLRKLNVFQAVKNSRGIEIVYGLDIIENGEQRRFPLHDVLSPILGYVGDKSDGRYTRPSGKKGLERSYEKHITSQKNGYFKGKRDVVSAVIHDRNSLNIPRVDGYDLHLNIPLALQRRVELMADKMKLSIDADEILVGVMESKTGKLLTLATSNRYDPAHIRQDDIPALVPKFSEYPYEAGSVLKPLTIGIALDKGVISPNSWFNTGYKKFDITGGQSVSDDDYFDSMQVADIIVHSSNIGTSQISWKLTGEEYREGLLKFGIAQKTGIDLSRDLPGSLKSLTLLNHKMHRANSSFGYGMMVTFSQMLKAYSAFNNNGLAMTPRLMDYLKAPDNKHYTIDPCVGNKQAIGKKAANDIHKILLEVVKRGTGVKAQYPGLEVGGKTGTAHIAKHGRYVREYHSSFYGFANDKEGHKYTIGVLVIRAKKWQKYFASQSAVPTFRRTLDILVELEYLTPDGEISLSPEIKLPVKKTESDLETKKKPFVKTKVKKKVKKKAPVKRKPFPKAPVQKRPALPPLPPVKVPTPAYDKEFIESIEDMF